LVLVKGEEDENEPDTIDKEHPCCDG